MKNIAYEEIYNRNYGSGLTNQIFMIVSNILINFFNDTNTNKNIIIFDNFLTDVKNNKYINSVMPISDIINIDEFNKYLYDNHNILIFDKNNINFDILSILYGTKDKSIDITNYIKNNCFDKSKNIFMLSNLLNLNDTFGDPLPGIQKKLYVTYSINNYEFNIEYDENMSHINETIEFDVKKKDYGFNLYFPFFLNESIYFDILNNIPFNHWITSYSDKFIKNIKTIVNVENKKINILHLRLEDDAINYWSQINLMGKEDYKRDLEEKYIQILKDNVQNKEEHIFIILGYNNDNRVLDYLNNNNYKYFICEKIDRFGREINAIIDLYNVRLCNNFFIGNFSIKNRRGSSFSYFILSRLNKEQNIKSILIDLDNLNDNNEIYYNYKPI